MAGPTEDEYARHAHPELGRGSSPRIGPTERKSARRIQLALEVLTAASLLDASFAPTESAGGRID